MHFDLQANLMFCSDVFRGLSWEIFVDIVLFDGGVL